MELFVHRAFYEKTSALSLELQCIENHVKEHESQLIEKIESVIRSINSISVQNNAHSSIQQHIQLNLNQISKQLSLWQEKVKSFNTNLTFRRGFGDSLLVFVYGKVKAGKSSLGNYVATGYSQPSQDCFKVLSRELHQPEFFLEIDNAEFDEKIDHNSGFAVGAAETTSCIQGFRVPGFTWVDSPGLHSVTDSNGDLSKQYSESADLIIYPFNTAQPGRRTDFEELRKLILANKRIMLLITRCSGEELDVDDEGEVIETLVMKSAHDRKAQENYVKKELDALCRELGKKINTTALSISVHYAEHYGNTPKAMKESGMQRFFEELGDIVTSEGVELKKQVPRKNLHYFYDLLLSEDSEISLFNITKQVSLASSSVQKNINDLRFETEKAAICVQSTFSLAVDSLVEKHALNRKMSELKKDITELIQVEIESNYTPVLKKYCEEALGSISNLAKSIRLSTAVEFKDSKESITVDYTKTYTAVASGAGAIIGGAIGFVASGFNPVGISIGSMIGGSTGGFVGKSINSKELVEIVVGDNREEIKATLHKLGQKIIEDKLNELEENAMKQLFSPLQDALNKIETETKNLQLFIEEQKNNV